MAQTWTTQGSLSTPRIFASFTKLPSGKVLAVGGLDTSASSVLVSELYDPAMNTWGSAASLPVATSNQNDILLSTGKVLIAGGLINNQGNFVANCYLYDPVGNSWTATGSMNHARADAGIFTLPSGDILIVGGSNSNQTAEIYSVIGGTWSLTTAPHNTHSSPHFAKTGNGLCVVAGDSSGTDTIEYFTESGATWTLVTIPGGVTITNTDGTANNLVTMANGNLICVGGNVGGSPHATCYIFDQSAHTLSSTGSMATARLGHSVYRQSNGTILAVGGDDNSATTFLTCEIYDPIATTWSALASLNLKGTRGALNYPILNDGRALLAGGESNISAFPSSVSTQTQTLSALPTNNAKKWSMELVF